MGIVVTDSMVDQFNRGQPWEPVDGAVIEGLHDVPAVRYITYGLTNVLRSHVGQTATQCREAHAPDLRAYH